MIRCSNHVMPLCLSGCGFCSKKNALAKAVTILWQTMVLVGKKNNLGTIARPEIGRSRSHHFGASPVQAFRLARIVFPVRLAS